MNEIFGSYESVIALTILQWAIVGLVYRYNIIKNWDLPEQYFIIVSIPIIGPVSIVFGIGMMLAFASFFLVPYGLFLGIKKLFTLGLEEGKK